MRVLVAAVLVGLLCAVGAAQAQEPSTEKISVVASTVRVRESRDTRSDVMFIWNRNIRPSPIGHAVLSCLKLGPGAITGGGLCSCTATFVMPLGKITMAGLLHSHRRYTLAVTGGTGRYVGAGGHAFVRRVGTAGEQRVVIFLK